MSFYPVVPPDATMGCAEDAALGLLGQAGMVAVRVADLACPARRGLGRDGRTALTAAGPGQGRSWGELLFGGADEPVREGHRLDTVGVRRPDPGSLTFGVHVEGVPNHDLP